MAIDVGTQIYSNQIMQIQQMYHLQFVFFMEQLNNRIYSEIIIIKSKINEGKKGPIFISMAKFWGDNTNKEFLLKFNKKNQVDDTERKFLLDLITEQNQKERNELLDNVIRIFDFIEYQEYEIIVMEIGEQDLQSYIQKGQSTIIQKLQICLDISLPIYYLHINNLKHCELTLQNYFKVNDKFKLIKFGHLSSIKGNKYISIQYPSPELLDSYDNLSDKVDIWQLGCLFYQIYNGSQLFKGHQNHIKEQMLNHTVDQNGLNKKISQLNCQAEMKNLIILMLQPDPTKRISITEVVDKLQQIQNPNSILISQKYQQKSVSNNQNQVNKQQQQEFKLSTQDKQPSNLKQSTQVNENNQKNQNISQEQNENLKKISQDQHKIQQINNQQPQQIEEKPIIFQQQPQQSLNEEQLNTMKDKIEKELYEKFKAQMKASESKYKEEIQKHQNDQKDLETKVIEMEKQLNNLIDQNKQSNQSQLQENRNLDSGQNQCINEVNKDHHLILKLKKEKFELVNQLTTELPKALKLFTQNLEKILLQDQPAQIQNNSQEMTRLKQLLDIV